MEQIEKKIEIAEEPYKSGSIQIESQEASGFVEKEHKIFTVHQMQKVHFGYAFCQ